MRRTAFLLGLLALFQPVLAYPNGNPGVPPVVEDEDLSRAIGLNPETGKVRNPTSNLFRLELGSAFAYDLRTDSVRPGLSCVLLGYTNRKGRGFKLSLDVFNNLAGLSIGYTFLPVLRPTLFLGYGTLFGHDRDVVKTKQESPDTVYFGLKIRLW